MVESLHDEREDEEILMVDERGYNLSNPNELLGHQWVMFNQPKGIPLDGLSEITLKFLLERTNFDEPWRGMGFASEVKAELTKALERKEHPLIRMTILDDLGEEKGEKMQEDGVGEICKNIDELWIESKKLVEDKEGPEDPHFENAVNEMGYEEEKDADYYARREQEDNSIFPMTVDRYDEEINRTYDAMADTEEKMQEDTFEVNREIAERKQRESVEEEDAVHIMISKSNPITTEEERAKAHKAIDDMNG